MCEHGDTNKLSGRCLTCLRRTEQSGARSAVPEAGGFQGTPYPVTCAANSSANDFAPMANDMRLMGNRVRPAEDSTTALRKNLDLAPSVDSALQGIHEPMIRAGISSTGQTRGFNVASSIESTGPENYGNEVSPQQESTTKVGPPDGSPEDSPPPGSESQPSSREPAKSRPSASPKPLGAKLAGDRYMEGVKQWRSIPAVLNRPGRPLMDGIQSPRRSIMPKFPPLYTALVEAGVFDEGADGADGRDYEKLCHGTREQRKMTRRHSLMRLQTRALHEKDGQPKRTSNHGQQLHRLEPRVAVPTGTTCMDPGLVMLQDGFLLAGPPTYRPNGSLDPSNIEKVCVAIYSHEFHSAQSAEDSKAQSTRFNESWRVSDGSEPWESDTARNLRLPRVSWKHYMRSRDQQNGGNNAAVAGQSQKNSGQFVINSSSVAAASAPTEAPERRYSASPFSDQTATFPTTRPASNVYQQPSFAAISQQSIAPRPYHFARPPLNERTPYPDKTLAPQGYQQTASAANFAQNVAPSPYQYGQSRYDQSTPYPNTAFTPQGCLQTASATMSVQNVAPNPYQYGQLPHDQSITYSPSGLARDSYPQWNRVHASFDSLPSYHHGQTMEQYPYPQITHYPAPYQPMQQGNPFQAMQNPTPYQPTHPNPSTQPTTQPHPPPTHPPQSPPPPPPPPPTNHTSPSLDALHDPEEWNRLFNTTPEPLFNDTDLISAFPDVDSDGDMIAIDEGPLAELRGSVSEGAGGEGGFFQEVL